MKLWTEVKDDAEKSIIVKCRILKKTRAYKGEDNCSLCLEENYKYYNTRNQLIVKQN